MPTSELSAPGRIEAPVQRAKVTPTSPGRFALLTPLRQETYDLLREVQDLLGHLVAPGGIGDSPGMNGAGLRNGS